MISDHVPEGYTFTFEEHLFNTEAHRLTQAAEGWRSFYLLHDKKRQVLASWHVHVGADMASSPYRATFGGPDFNNRLQYSQLNGYVSDVNDYLAKLSISQVQIILPPELYNAELYSSVVQALFENGYQLSKSAIDAAISVSHGAFKPTLHRGNKRKLTKSVEAGFKVSQVQLDQLASVYQLLLQNRSEKGYRLSLNFEELSQLVKQFPTRFLLYAVYDGVMMIAAACCIKVRSDVLYVFYAGHTKQYNSYSPLVLLYDGIYEDCQRQAIRLIDLGTSATESGTDQNLLIAKLRMGAKASLKTTWIKQL